MSNLTKNNTSASSSYVWNSTDLNIQKDFNSGSPFDKSSNISPALTSKDSIHNLLYAGATTQVLAFYEPWWGQAGHIAIGLDETLPATAVSQVQDMAARGINGAVVNWFGPNQLTPATANLQAAAQAQANFKWCLQLDSGAPALNTTDPTSALVSILQYANANYFSSSAYLKVGGRPVILLQSVATQYTAINWATVRSAITGFSQGNPLLIFNDVAGFSQTQSDGAFARPLPGSVTSTDPAALSALNTFYATAKANPGKLTFGCLYKGFNNALKGFSTVSSISQRNGQTWLDTATAVNTNYSSTNQLGYVIVNSWNDYESGTEIETGISSAIQVTAKITGNLLSWTLSAATQTLLHYDIESTQDGSSYTKLVSGLSLATNSFTLPSLANGTYLISVLAVSKDSLQHVQSNEINYVVSPPASPPSLLALAPTAGSTAGGTAVTLSGTAFASGATVKFGVLAASNVVFISAASLSCVTPAESAGVVDVIVTNPDGQTSTLAAAFTFVTPPPPQSTPNIASVSPTSGTTLGGDTVTLNGSGFVSGATVKIGGVTAASVTFVSSSQVTVVTPAGSAGLADVTLLNTDGGVSTLAGGFTYISPTPPAPTLSALSPVSGPISGGTTVVLTGTNFATGITVQFGIGNFATNVVLAGAGSVSCSTPAVGAGAVDVIVTNADNQAATLAGGYTYIAPPPLVDANLTAVFPSVGASGVAVTLTGTAFVSGMTATIGGVAIADLQVTTSTSAWGHAPTQAPGSYDVVVTDPNTSTSTLAQGFTYVVPTSGGPAPTPPFTPPLAAALVPPAPAPVGVQEFYYTRELPARAVLIASLSTPPLTPAQLTDVNNFPYQQGPLAIWIDSGTIAQVPDFTAPDFGQTVTIQGSVDYLVGNQFFELTDVFSPGGRALYYYHLLPSPNVTGVTILDLAGNLISSDILIVGTYVYHDLGAVPYQIRFVDQVSGRVIVQLLRSTPVLGPTSFNPTPTSYSLVGASLTVFSTAPLALRFLVANGYYVLGPYSTPPNTPWYARVRFGLTPVAPEWARQVFLPRRPYQLAAWVPGQVLSAHLVEFERKQIFFDPDHLPDVLVYDQDFALKFALEGTAPSLPRRHGTVYPWKRGLVRDIDPYEGRLELGIELAPSDQVFGFYSYVEPDVIYRAIDLNPFTNPAVRNKVVQFYFLNDPVNSPFQNIYHEVFEPADPIVLTAPDVSDPNKVVFSRVVVGAVVGPRQFDLSDERVRGGGLAKPYQSIPEAANFWDLGYWDGKPYPIGGGLVLYLPAAILDTLDRNDIQGRIANALPLGSLPVIRFVNPDGSEFV